MERNVLALTFSAVLALAIGTALADPSYLQFITSSLLAIPAFNYCYDSPFCTVSQKTISKLASKPQGVSGAWPTDATHSGSKSDPATRSNDELDRKRVDSACDVAIRPPSSRDDEESRAHTRNVNGVAGNFKDQVSESRRLATKVLVPEVTAPSPRYLEETEFLKRLAEMEAEHSRTVESIQKIHKDEIVRIGSEHASQLETLHSQISKANFKISAQRFAMNENLDRIKTEHEAELKRFRESETGRLAEMETVHSRDIESIRKIHEGEIIRIRSEHGTMLETLNSQISDASSKIFALEAERFVMNEKFDRVRAQHEVELKQFRETEVSGRLAEMETVHSRDVESIRKAHEDQIVRIRSEHAAQLETYNSQTSDASSKISELEAERFVMNEKIDRIRTEHEAELKRFQESSDQALKQEELKSAELLQRLDEQRQHIENELTAGSVTGKENDVVQDSKKIELENRIAELERELETSAEKHQQALEAAQFEYSFILAQVENDQRRHVTETNYLKFQIDELQKNVSSVVETAVLESQRSNQEKLKEERQRFEATMGALMDKVEMFARRG